MNAIIDNWTLQNVGELISGGFSRDDASVIRICDNMHNYTDIPECFIQAEALFDILTDLVLRETLLVDGEFTYTWESAGNPLASLSKERILRSKPFREFEDDFDELRSYLAGQMCVTESLKKAHAENVESWAVSGQTKDQYLAGVLWGGAGMVARSSTFRIPYSPHPLRRRLFLATRLFLDGSSPHPHVKRHIDETRLRLLKASASENQLYTLRVLLPPIPTQVINDADGPSDLIETAIQLRKEYAPLRDWLSEIEDAVEKDDLVQARKLHKILEEVTRKVDRAIGVRKSDETLSVGLGAISFSKGINVGRPLLKATKVYSILNRMIFNSSGESALRRLCQMFDKNGTVVERKLREHFGIQ